jgi:L-alanine-DL-glutamate epimerase-like enolase superfamily enzyme
VKISSVESIILMDQYHLVRVQTDEGLSGVGEVSPMNARVTHALVEHALAPLLIGQDPARIEQLWQRMYHKPYKLGPMGAQLEAMAGVDIALWDIAGKAAGKPVYELLGGLVREAPEVYASSMQRGMAPEVEAERALSFKEQGYRAYKIHSATPWMADDGEDYTIDTVREMRKAVGDDFDILVDVNNAYLPHTAIKVARRLEEYGVWHFEEPLAAHDHAGYAALAAAVDIPIAAGEQEYTKWQMRDLILQAHIDILQPDVIKCGGITEFRKIAALAETFSKPITVHNTQPTIGTLAHLHLWASTPSCIYPQEYNIEVHPLRDEYPIWQEPVLPEKGRMVPPSAPGLGVELDDELVDRLRSV